MSESYPILMDGVREHAESMDVSINLHSNGRLVVRAWNEAGYSATDVDLLDLISWLKKNMPHLLEK